MYTHIVYIHKYSVMNHVCVQEHGISSEETSLEAWMTATKLGYCARSVCVYASAHVRARVSSAFLFMARFLQDLH